MNGSVPATILYVASYIVLFSGFFVYPKSAKEQYGMTWLPLTGIMTECYTAFVAAIISLLHIPTNLVTLGILNAVMGIVLWYLVKKRGKKQTYRWSYYDIVFALLLLFVVLMFSQARYGLLSLDWSYRTVDPSARYRESMEFVNDQAVSRMFFAQLTNGVLIELLRPFQRYDYYYRSYVLGDILQLFLSGMMFYGAVRRLTEKDGKKDHFVSITAIVATLFYLLGYPLNSTLYGFTYLGMILYLTVALLYLTDMFLKDEQDNKWFHVILLSLVCHAYFQCYVLFMPVTFLAIGFAFLFKQHSQKKLLSVDTFVTALAIFLPAVVLGLTYTYLDVFVNDNITVESAISAEGAIYRDLYSNFIFFAPVAVLGLIRLLRGKKNRFLTWFAPMFLLFMLGMFVISYKTGKISTYYFAKDYYMLWLIVFLLVVYAIAGLKSDGRKVTVAYLCSWAFVAMMFLTGLESRIESKNPLFVPDHKSQHYNDLLCFNWNTAKTEHYSADKMDLIHYVYENLTGGGGTDKPVPVVTRQEETYLYESMTGQRLKDFDYWIDEEHRSDYFENIGDCDYVTVYIDSDLYAEHQDMFDAMERVYENPAGFVARVR